MVVDERRSSEEGTSGTDCCKPRFVQAETPNGQDDEHEESPRDSLGQRPQIGMIASESLDRLAPFDFADCRKAGSATPPIDAIQCLIEP